MSDSEPCCPSFITVVLDDSLSFLSLFARVSSFDLRSNVSTVPVSSLALDPIAPVELPVMDEPLPVVPLEVEPVPLVDGSVAVVEPVPLVDGSVAVDEPVPLVDVSVDVPAPLDDEPVAVDEPVPVDPVPLDDGSVAVDEPLEPVPCVSLELEEPVLPAVSLEVEPVDDPVPIESWLVLPVDCPDVELPPVLPLLCAFAGAAAARIAAAPRPAIVPHPNHFIRISSAAPFDRSSASLPRPVHVSAP